MAIEEFNNGDRLKTIREGSLNPLITKVTKNIDPRLDSAETKISGAITSAELDPLDNKRITFHKIGGGEFDLDLHHIIPDEFPGISIIGKTGAETNLKRVTIKDAAVTAGTTSEDANVTFDWQNIVPDNQRELQGMVDMGVPTPIRTIKFAGDTSKVNINAAIATLTIPSDPVEFKAKVDDGTGGGVEKTITKILIEGNTTGSSVSDTGELTIKVPVEGGGAGGGGNFQGFFDNEGELISTVTNPINGKSFAFVKDKTFSAPYYDAYMYVGNTWTEVPIDPGMTYEQPNVPNKQGVFSIKPSQFITIDANGQLDLDRLAESGGFAGFFDSQTALEAAVPNPIPDRSYGYIRQAVGSWLGLRFTHNTQTGEKEWKPTVAFGATAVVTKTPGKPDVTVVAYGFVENEMISIDHVSGLATITPGSSTTMKVSVANHDGSLVETHPVKDVTYTDGASMVGFTGANKDKLVVSHPQRVINYNTEFEAAHNSQDYRGNIFYDDTSRAWMGWATPEAAGAVDKKWTRIAHQGMSDQVKDLDKRVPQKAPVALGGTYGDNAQWEHSGWSYVEPDAHGTDLPEQIRASGAYVQTYVKNVDGETGIPQQRMQTCYEDKDGGSQWVRRFDSTPPNIGDPAWKPWVRTSFSEEDIHKHERDPNCHKDVFKFYRVDTVTGIYQTLHNQTQDGFTGQIREDNYHVLQDPYGYTHVLDDSVSVPYDNGFTIGGVFEFSGYNGGLKPNVPLGKWTVLIRILRNGDTKWEKLKEWYYTHTTTVGPYPSISFSIDEKNAVNMVRGDKISAHLIFDNPEGLKNQHPDLYIVPLRSYLYMQDKFTRSGELIAANQRKFYGTLDVNGDLGVKIHHVTPSDTNTKIRVYGSRITKDAEPMKTVP